MSFKTKLALGAGSLGVIGGGGAVASHLLSGETIKDHLQKKGFTFLKDDASEWTTILASYTTAISTKPDLKFGEFTGGDNKVKELREQCQALLNQKHKTPETSKNYKKTVWCVKEQTVSDYLKFEGYEAFNTVEGNSTNDNDWNEKIKEYSKHPAPPNKKVISGLTLSGNNLTNPTPDDRKKIKESCKTLNAKKHYETDFESSKELVILWCSKVVNNDKS
ncbi:hypothetical protein A6V39_00075 [Candidatus Mycoplasma haematobovis]|uniref:Uncharacterized protein n=1 Tax=Candidatus Mycoplasma haematobovis TaxID=432608 RepID=A0A1A9QER0_9MOLU|nr:hypothetical protein [Candidatus Mycoplasma haematobovis]OAL10445.1 hypothetical protein A6V39_00075 [Candidatus Mycoplasma haematobovis]